MPNGGSDCCGTCWFNAHNKGTKHRPAGDPEPNFCNIRGLAIENAFWTYCANHPARRPNRDPIPIGPVYVDKGGYPYDRKVWQLSPDTEEIRLHLLELLCGIHEQSTEHLPADYFIVWQLGEFREPRAVAGLQRVAAFNSGVAGDTFSRESTLVAAAKEALSKISA